jgi:hypothetical protein
MTVETKPELPPTVEQRKKLLIAHGRTCRDELDHSLDIVRENLHLDRIAKTVVTHATASAYRSVENVLHLSSLNSTTIRRFLPFVTAAYSIVTRRRLVVPVLRGAAVAAGVSAGAYFYYRHKKRMHALEVPVPDGADSMGPEL